jgi:hypothetical protein
VPNDNDSLLILQGNGDGAFTPALSYASGTGPIAVGDFNGDGKPDIVAADDGTNNVYVLLNATR